MKEKFQNKKVREAVDLLLEGGADLSKALEKGGLIKELTKAILERAMEAEMSEHLGFMSLMNALHQKMLGMALTIKTLSPRAELLSWTFEGIERVALSQQLFLKGKRGLKD